MYNSFLQSSFDYNTLVSRSIFLKFSGKTPGAISLPQFAFRVVMFSLRPEWRLFIFISRESKWGTLKSAGTPRCAVPAEIHSICTDRRDLGLGEGLQVSPTSDTCQSVAILMNRRHSDFCVRFPGLLKPA